MKTKITILCVAAVLTVAWIVACENVRQPKSLCAIGQGPYAVKYTPKSGQSLTGPCATVKGELIGVRDYGDKRTTYYIAIGAQRLGGLVSATGYQDDPSNHIYSYGPYSFDPGPDDFCEAGPLDTAFVQFPTTPVKQADGGLATLPDGGSPVLPDGGPAREPDGGVVRQPDGGLLVLPAIPRRSYEWKKVRFLNVAEASGNQMSAELTYTDTNGDGCVGTYDVVGVWPGVPCGLSDGGTDPNLCATRVNPDGGFPKKVGCNGSLCFSSNQKVKCDPDVQLCVLDGTPPVFAQ